ncbi:MAG: pentapeptide repeat-containing protein, partial [Alphaproteobacteria bacterium]|nr:pentapeptide repeat-containing protein [Alphaproteobacteria bacterium]
NFAEANLSGAVLSDADLRGANLAGAKLIEATLERALFTPIPIRKADGSLSGQVHKTNLTNADLSNARVKAADFRGARLDGLGTEGVDLKSGYFDAS